MSAPDERGDAAATLSVCEVQAAVDRWVHSAGGYYSPLTNLGRLTEELGELARILNRTDGELKTKPGDDTSPQALEAEFGDLFFTLACLANQKGVDLTQAITSTLTKYTGRSTQTEP